MTDRSWTRRDFLTTTAMALGTVPLAGAAGVQQRPAAAPIFRISLAQWSLNRDLRAKQLDHLDFARVAQKEFGIEAIEYVNTFFKDKATDAAYLAEMNRRAAGRGRLPAPHHGATAKGNLGDPDDDAAARRPSRTTAGGSMRRRRSAA